jgi:hypothetical protein
MQTFRRNLAINTIQLKSQIASFTHSYDHYYCKGKAKQVIRHGTDDKFERIKRNYAIVGNNHKQNDKEQHRNQRIKYPSPVR